MFRSPADRARGDSRHSRYRRMKNVPRSKGSVREGSGGGKTVESYSLIETGGKREISELVDGDEFVLRSGTEIFWTRIPLIDVFLNGRS